MIKQNIHIALFAILGLIVLWLIIFCFIRIDVSTQSFITFENTLPSVSLLSKEATYIEEHNRAEHIRFYYDGSYHWCELIDPIVTDDITTYLLKTKVTLPEDKPIAVTLILDSLNVYEYWIKK